MRPLLSDHSERRELDLRKLIQTDSAGKCETPMSSRPEQFPLIYLARHGETAWSISGQYTGLTDLPLTERGEENAKRLGKRLVGTTVTRVFTSPLQRASRTCELAGFGIVASSDPDLVEWNYGRFDGKTNVEILRDQPGWELFRDGCPGGESIGDVVARAQRVVDRIRAAEGSVLLFSHGHFLRVLTTCWLGLEPTASRCLELETAALCILGYKHGLQDPVLHLWNDCSHERDSRIFETV
jgi:broad specificity phosphatase PhoE